MLNPLLKAYEIYFENENVRALMLQISTSKSSYQRVCDYGLHIFIFMLTDIQLRGCLGQCK